MQLKYNKEDDILLIELNKEKIDYAEQSGDVIVHFSPQRQAVLMEILDASKFLKQTITHLPENILKTLFPPVTNPAAAAIRK